MAIQNITIIGQGNVASHYYKAMTERKFIVKMISSRLPFDKADLQSDIVIIAVKDEAIEMVVKQLPKLFCMVVHTSGYISTKCLKKVSNNYGSLYPLQTLKKGVAIDFSQVPLCIWGSNEKTTADLEELAGKLTRIHYNVDDKGRKTLHLAAVFANNFTNHLFGIAKNLLDKEKIPFEILLPLIDRTVEAIKQNNPYDIQTGPAIRGDLFVMEQHKLQLDETKRKIYDIISDSIMEDKSKQ